MTSRTSRTISFARSFKVFGFEPFFPSVTAIRL